MPRVIVLPVLLGVAAAVSIVMLWGVEWPLGIPGEWTWPRMPASAETARGMILAGLLASGLLVALDTGARRLETLDQRASRATGAAAPRARRSARRFAAGALLALALATFAWWGGLLASVPGVFGLQRAPVVLYFPGMTGYFLEARSSTATTAEFLAGYEQSLATRDDPQRYLHLGTHPPGLILMFRGLLAGVSRPGVARAVLATAPAAARESLESIAASARRSNRPFGERDMACLWLGVLLTGAVAAAGVIPLYGLLRRRLPGSQALRWAGLWPFIPAVAVFLPKDDVLFPTIVLLAGWTWTMALERRSPAAFVMSVLTGLLACGGLLLSLAFLPLLLWLAVAAWGETWGPRKTPSGLAPLRGAASGHVASSADSAPTPQTPDEAAAQGVSPAWRRLGLLACGALTGAAGPILLFWLKFQCSLPNVWLLNFRNHGEFYSHSPRTYWAWLLVNPIELMLSVGAPLAVLAALGALRLLRSRPMIALSRGAAPQLATAVVFAGLWLSGKNMGEAARLWIPFLPWLIVSAAHGAGRPAPLHAAGAARLAPLPSGALRPPGESTEPPASAGPSHPEFPAITLWRATAVLQIIVCLAAAFRIDGFGLTTLPP